MEKLKRALYAGWYKGNMFEILTWVGTPLNVVWNEEKWRFLPGDVVVLEDCDENRQTFVKGLF